MADKNEFMGFRQEADGIYSRLNQSDGQRYQCHEDGSWVAPNGDAPTILITLGQNFRTRRKDLAERRASLNAVIQGASSEPPQGIRLRQPNKFSPLNPELYMTAEQLAEQLYGKADVESVEKAKELIKQFKERAAYLKDNPLPMDEIREKFLSNRPNFSERKVQTFTIPKVSSENIERAKEAMERLVKESPAPEINLHGKSPAGRMNIFGDAKVGGDLE